jgi:hypothetical protein
MLTQEQIAFRKHGIGGSDASVIMYGDAGAWEKLRLEKKEGIEPTFNKQQRRLMDMGSTLEPLALRFFGEDYGGLRPLSDKDACRSWALEPLFRCILDGIGQDGTPVQIKFHSGDRTIDELAEQYTPQLQHEMLVTDAGSIWLGVLFGHYGQFRALRVNADADFIDTYTMKAMQFQEFWKTGKLPAGFVAEKRREANIARLRDHVFDQNDNEITTLAMEWLLAKEASENMGTLAGKLKALFPDDARTAKWMSPGRGIGILMKKNRTGVISLSAL